ncbi:MAG: hypothetical protein QGH45_01065 [Myxococcota bacterium]|nr:hypothetical protein [Myxococcota bacterium]
MRAFPPPVLYLVAVLGLLAAAASGGASGIPHGLAPEQSDCARCHEEEDFDAIHRRQVHQDGAFPLIGEHSELECKACHDVEVELGFESNVAECSLCHKARDGHRRLVGDDCRACHTPRGWLPNHFRHVTTGWALTGAHRAASCGECHAIGFAIVPTDCTYCHEGDFRRADTDQHERMDIMNCDFCHNTHGWEHVRYPH